MKLNPYLSLCTKINSKQIKDLRHKTIKLEENIGEKLYDNGLVNDFLDMTPKAQATKMNRQMGLCQNKKEISAQQRKKKSME